MGTGKTIGCWLRQLREERRLPLRTVAAAVEIDSTLLSHIERGTRLPTPAQSENLAAYFNLPKEEFEAIRLAEKFFRENQDNPAAIRAAELIRERASEYRVDNRSKTVKKPPHKRGKTR